MNEKTSNRLRHFFHVVSNIRPIVWIATYVAITPVFALIYWALPDAQFRIPDGAGTDYGSWLYYSIVTITTLGFGDYTPAHGWAQAVTAVEVMCGLIFLGLFLNAVGSMKSEIDVESEIEKQKRLHASAEKEKLVKGIPLVLRNLNMFLAYCYAVTTPADKRGEETAYNPDFEFSDMADLFHPSGLPFDATTLPAVERLLKCAANTSLCLDSLQNRVDLTLWPDVLEGCFSFVAGFQMFSSADALTRHSDGFAQDGLTEAVKRNEARISAQVASWRGPVDVGKAGTLQPVAELYFFIKQNASLARSLETELTSIAMRFK